jgi:methylmalonyl-CoA/ethylmalonyl-CoA epimerase
MPNVTKVNHVAIVVDDLEKALGFWRDALGLRLGEVREVASEQARTAFLPLGDSELELVKATSQDSGMARYLAKRGPGMHHICLEVDDLAGMLDQLRAGGVRLITDQPRVGEDGRQYAFVHPEATGGVLLELYQRRP